MAENYGIHLTARVREIEHFHKLDDEALLQRFLVDLVTTLNFRVLAGPLSARELGPPDRAGVSTVLILYESHVAMHTYPAVRSAFLDVFGCREFAARDVFDAFRTEFGKSSIHESNLVVRGTDWGRDATIELNRWQSTR